MGKTFDAEDIEPLDPPLGSKPDPDSAIELLKPYNAENFARLLRDAKPSAKLSTTGTKPQLIDRVRKALDDGHITVRAVIERLDAVQGWGNQHVYLYIAPDGLGDRWSNEVEARRIIKAAGHASKINVTIPTLLPRLRKLVSIQWTTASVRFIWVETRFYNEFLGDEEEGDVVKRIYLKRRGRGVLVFDWDLATGRAMLMIQRLPSGTNYPEIRDSLVSELKPMVDLAAFERVPLANVIEPIADSGEARPRQLKPQTKKKSIVSISSPSKAASIDDDDEAKAVRKQMKGRPNHLGNFYWNKAGPLRYEFHTTLLAADDRISIPGERSQKEVRHVLARVWHHLGL